jgi:hypothetical protein
MFIRFACGEIDSDSHVSAGLFCAAFNLLDEMDVVEDEYAALADLMGWFRVNLRGPFEYRLRSAWRARRAISWFKPTARAHLSRAWDMTTILERNNVPIRMIKARSAGYILYEDEAQIFAEPFADIRRVLRR